MSIISYRYNLFVTATPKVACTSLKQAFFRLENGFSFRDFTANGISYNVHNIAYPPRFIKDYDKTQLSGLRKFAVVRDPVERLISFFNDKIIDKDCLSVWQPNNLKKNNLTCNPDFDFFVDHLAEYRQTVSEVKHHTDPITDFVGDPNWYDEVFSIKNLKKFQSEISEISGVDFIIPRDNFSSSILKSTSLSSETIEKIRTFYADDYLSYGDYMDESKPSKLAKMKNIMTSDNFKETETLPDFNVSKSSKKTFHILGIPHTITTKEYSICAFTQKVLKLSRMLTDLGHEVIHYGHEDSNVVCTEHVSVISRDDHLATYGAHNWRQQGFPAFSIDDRVYQTFRNNAVSEIKKRKKANDFLLCSYGSGHKEVADELNGMIVCEPGIGYPEGHFAPFKIFESYAVLHAYHGLKAVQYAKNDFWYDVVIPNYYDLDDFTYSNDKQDYMLFLGRVSEGKGVHIAIQLANACKKKLIIAGPDMYNTLERFDGFNSEYISYVGQVGPEWRSELLSQAKCVLLPSTFLEPFCGVHIEAMLCGTPVISSDWGAFAEYNLHGYTGYRCQTFEQFCWAINNIDRINPSYCRQWAKENFNLDRIAAMYDDYFDSVYNIFNGQGWYEPKNRIELDMWKKIYPDIS
jgi:glycosyltransferase involved in cell wall biosynthesis